MILVRTEQEPDALYLSMSALSEYPEPPEAYHAWVASKAAWHEITDELPQFDAEPPADALR